MTLPVLSARLALWSSMTQRRSALSRPRAVRIQELWNGYGEIELAAVT
jgi:hypothetical protein